MHGDPGLMSGSGANSGSVGMFRDPALMSSFGGKIPNFRSQKFK